MPVTQASVLCRFMKASCRRHIILVLLLVKKYIKLGGSNSLPLNFLAERVFPFDFANPCYHWNMSSSNDRLLAERKGCRARSVPIGEKKYYVRS